MPSDKVQYQYDKLDEIAQTASSKSEAAAAVRQRLNQQLQVLQDGGWVGAGAVTFFNEMNSQIFPAMTKLETAFDNLSAVLRRASEMMRDAEQQCAAGFKGDGGGALNGGSTGGSGGGSTGGGASGSGGGMTTQKAVAKGIDILSKLLGIGDGGSDLLKGVFKNVDSFGEFSKKAHLGTIGNVLALVSVGVDNWGKPDFFEKIADKTASLGVNMLLTKNPVGAAITIASDVNQIVGQGASFGASQLNSIANDPGLGQSIARFDSTLSNADAGAVIDSAGTVIVDYMQTHFAGMKEVWNNPTPLNIAMAMTPGGLFGVGLMGDNGMAAEMGQNSLVMLGNAADFVVGVAQTPSAYADLAENSMRVGLQEMGLSRGFSEAASGAFGFAADAFIAGTNPLGFASSYLPSFDFSDAAKGLFQ